MAQSGRLLIDCSLILLLFCAPLALGGRHPVGQSVYCFAILPGCCGALLLVLSGAQLRLRSAVLLLVFGSILVPAIQLVPLNQSLVACFSPSTPEITAGSKLLPGSSDWATLSLAPAQTLQSLAILTAYAWLFLVVTLRIRSAEDIERIFNLLAASAVFLAILALLQATWGNGRFLWVYDHPTREPGSIPRGPFQNENHLSHILALALPAILSFLLRPLHSRFLVSESGGSRNRRRRSRELGDAGKRELLTRTSAVFGCIVIVATVYATPSRGGALVVAMGAAGLASFLSWQWLGRRIRCRPANWCAAGALIATAIACTGLAYLVNNITELSYWRQRIWAADLEIIKDFPLFGIGVGAHRYVYRAYLGEYCNVTFSSSESSWLQILTEAGLLGGITMIGIVLVAGISLARVLAFPRQIQHLLLAAAAFGGLLASCLHAAIDFPWHIPACAVANLVLLAAVLRLPDLDGDPNTGRPHPSPPREHGVSGTTLPIFALMVAGVGLTTVLACRTVPSAKAAIAWDAYVRSVRFLDQTEFDARATGVLDEAQRLLRTTLARDPMHVRARRRLTENLLAHLQLPDVPHTTRDEVAADALNQASVVAQLCPTEASTYLSAARAELQLGGSPSRQLELLRWAHRLDKVDGQTSMRLALLESARGRENAARGHWKNAFETDESFREQALAALTTFYKPSLIVQRFEPSRISAGILYTIARQGHGEEEALRTGEYYCRLLLREAMRERKDALAANLLDTAAAIAKGHRFEPLLSEILSQQIGRDPRRLDYRLDRIELLMHSGRLADAAAELSYCKELAPRDDRLRHLALRFDKAKQHKIAR